MILHPWQRAPDIDPATEGAAAYHMAKEHEHNPYDRSDPRHDEWRRGWFAAQGREVKS